MISKVFNNTPPTKVFSYTIALNYIVGYEVLSHNHVEVMLAYRTMVGLSLLKLFVGGSMFFCYVIMLCVFASKYSGVQYIKRVIFVLIL